MFRSEIKELSSYDLIEDIKLISKELESRFNDNESCKDLSDLIASLSDKMLVKLDK